MAPELTFERLAAGSPFPAIAGPAGVSLLTRNGHALLAVRSGEKTFDRRRRRPRRSWRRWKALERRRRRIRDGATRSRSTPCSPEPAKRCGPTSSTCAWRSTCCRPGVGSRRARADGVPAPRPAAGARQGGRGRPRAPCPGPTRSSMPTAGWPSAPPAPPRWRRLLSAELAARPELEKSLPRDRAAAHSRARADGARRRGDRQPASRRDVRAHGEASCAPSSRRSGPEAGEEFNVNSPVKLGQILFEKLKYPVLKKTAKTRSSSTGFEVLTELAEQGLRLPKLVLEYREISKLKGTYVDALPAARRRGRAGPLLVPADGRGDRAALVVGPQPPEHPDPNGGGSRDPPGLRRAARASGSSSPTTRRSSCASWRICRATRP